MSRNVLLKILGGAKNPAHLRRWINFWPPFLGAGIRIRYISPDTKAVDVEMKLRFWNRNYVGTHFGGSLYSMTDPFFMLMLLDNLGPEYLVWDKAATIRFKKPGRGKVRAEFRLSDEQLDETRPGQGQERHPGFPGDRPGQEGLAGARWAHHEHAAGSNGAGMGVALRMGEEVDHLGHLTLCPLVAGDVAESGRRPVLVVHLGLRTSEAHDPAGELPRVPPSYPDEIGNQQ